MSVSCIRLNESAGSLDAKKVSPFGESFFFHVILNIFLALRFLFYFSCGFFHFDFITIIIGFRSVVNVFAKFKYKIELNRAFPFACNGFYICCMFISTSVRKKKTNKQTIRTQNASEITEIW